MKLISLNTWGGRAGLDNLLKFFESHKEVDIFCLQEIWNGGEHMLTETAGGMILSEAIPQLYKRISKAIPNYIGYFRPHFYDFYGLAMFVKNDLNVIEEGDIFVYKEHGFISPEENGNHARNIQYVTVDNSKGVKTLVNFHGLWNGGGKGDSEDRLLQSDNMARFLKNLSNPHVLCGDFNLLPETESLKRLEALGLKNLIKKYGIKSTRTKFYTKEHKFADYTLVSKEIKVNDFKILPDEVSDHNAMYLDFE